MGLTQGVAASQLASASFLDNPDALPDSTSEAFRRIREDFDRGKAAIEEEGAAKLAGSDLDAQAARLLAGQTSRELGIGALALAGQLERAVLQLFQK